MGDVNLVCSVNEKYLPIINVFLKSIEANSKNTFDKIIIRCIGFDPDFSKINLNIIKIIDNKSLSKKKNMLSKEGEYINDTFLEGLKKSKIGIRAGRWLYSEEIAYCSNSKVLTIYDTLQKYNLPVLYSDVDTIVKGNLTDLVGHIKENDVCVVEDEPYTQQHKGSKRLEGQDKLYQGGFISFNNNIKVKNFVKKWSDLVIKNYTDWDADEKYFYDVINENKLNVYNLDKTFKDDDLNMNSIVWSGSGTTKFCDDRYVKEYNKYR
tara:strand:+ start:403 stop:1197 length:795 start_codon:yes stop_codon:yes gene_type:complete